MGCLNSRSAVERFKYDHTKYTSPLSKIEECNNENENSCNINILLLGAPRSGKSTIFRQMTQLHGNEFSEIELETFAKVIIQNTLDSMCNILEFVASSDPPVIFEDPQVSTDMTAVLEYKDKTFNVDIPQHLWDCVERLWANELVQESFENFDHKENYLLDSAAYLLNNVDRFRDPLFTPNEDDILRFYVRTTGFHDITFSTNEDHSEVNLIDCGSDHRRWVHCLKAVHKREQIIVFCVALSEYNLVLFRDIHTNRMHYSLKLFESVLNHADQDALIVLFLNKMDLFEKKLKKFPLNVCFSDYQGRDNLKEACQFIKDKFEVLGACGMKNQEIHTHFTSAIDLKSRHALWDNIISCSKRVVN